VSCHSLWLVILANWPCWPHHWLLMDAFRRHLIAQNVRLDSVSPFLICPWPSRPFLTAIKSHHLSKPLAQSCYYGLIEPLLDSCFLIHKWLHKSHFGDHCQGPHLLNQLGELSFEGWSVRRGKGVWVMSLAMPERAFITNCCVPRGFADLGWDIQWSVHSIA
jgi:hypothetical protein